MNFSILRGWCGRRAEPAERVDQAAADNAIAEAQKAERIAVQEAERLRAEIARLEREVDAERAENQRLVARLSRMPSGYGSGTAGPPPVPAGTESYWMNEALRQRQNNAALDNRLALAEGRPAPFPAPNAGQR